MTEPSPYLTIQQAADHLQMSTSTIREYMRTGRLKGYRVAGRRKLLFHIDDVNSLLCAVTPTQPKKETAP